MKVGFAVQANEGIESKVFNYFGSAPVFIIVDAASSDITTVNNQDLHHVHGACNPIKALDGQRVDAMVVGGIGAGALSKLNAMGILELQTAGGIMDSITLKPIGVIHSPFTDPKSMPIQPVSENSATGTVEVFPEFAAGLRDLEGFSHILLVYHFHRSRAFSLTVIPYLDTEPRGLFATRAPNRPNPIGLSLVRLARIEGARLHVENIDVLDGTPLLDIKPHVPEFDCAPGVRIGWLERAAAEIRKKKADDRFS